MHNLFAFTKREPQPSLADVKVSESGTAIVAPAPLSNEQRARVDAISSCGLTELQAAFMVRRGLDTPNALFSYLQPTLPSIQEIMTIPGMRASIDRVLVARNNGEKIKLFGDFDVDGICSVAIVTRALSSLGIKTTFDTPCRRTEGYGMNFRMVDDAAGEGVKLVIALDFGTTQNKVINYARERGIEVIVIDHHQGSDFKPPDAVAIVNPNLSNSDFGALCAGGLALLWAIGLQFRATLEIDLDPLYALAAVATVADVASLSAQENRAIVLQGLPLIRTVPGLASLTELIDKSASNVSAADVAFGIGPALNAPGRVRARASGDLSDKKSHGALDCYQLLTSDVAPDLGLARSIVSANKDRKIRELSDYSRAQGWVARLSQPLPAALVFADDFIDPGLAGLVSARLSQQFDRPSAVVAMDGKFGRGSVRAGASAFNVHAALKECGQFLDHFGGHPAAGGFKIRREKVEGFRSAFIAATDKQLKKAEREQVTADMVLSLSDFLESKDSLANELSIFEPFGNGNPAPILVIPEVKITQSMPMGREHFKLTLSDGSNTTTAFLWRGRGSPLSKSGDTRVTLACRVGWNRAAKQEQASSCGREVVLEVIGKGRLR